MKGYLWTILPMAKLAQSLMGVRDTCRYETGETQNRELFLFLILVKGLFHDSSVIVHLFIYVFSDFITMQTREQWHENMKGKEGSLKVNTINVVQPS